MSEVRVEICLETVDDVAAAKEGGAHRVELCAGLVEGGLTPSPATIEMAVELGVEVMVMIRPRGGDFCYSERELAVMRRDIAFCARAGASGVVFGILDERGNLARTQVQALLELAKPMQVTFHRAFDVCRDPMATFGELLALGVDRLLTSGQRATVPEGIDLIATMVQRGGNRLSVMPGCGITPANAGRVVQATGAREIHATAWREWDSPVRHRNPEVYMGVPGLSEYRRRGVDAGKVRKLIRAAQSTSAYDS